MNLQRARTAAPSLVSITAVALIVSACGGGGDARHGGASGSGTAGSSASSGGDRAVAADVMACLPVARCGAWDGYGRGYCAALRSDGTLALPERVHAAGAPEPARVCPGEQEAAPGLQSCMDYVETQRDCAQRPRTGVPGFQCVRVEGGCAAR